MVTSFQNNSHPSQGGVLSLWRGLGPTLWRDVPFSGIYWLGYEQLRTLLIQPGVEDSTAVGMIKSFIAGAGSGLVASVLTHPFDVAKTRVQLLNLASYHPNTASLESSQPLAASAISSSSGIPRSQTPSTATILRNIVGAEGVKGLYAGVFPRLTKVAPSCAIMISAYEGAKALYRHHVKNNNRQAHL